jgi:nucleotide-binding universal stress UspA family protein
MNTILVHMTPDPGCQRRLTVAVALAQAQRAHLVGVYTRSPFVTPPAIVGRGASAVFAREMAAAAAEQEQDASVDFKSATAQAGLDAAWIHHDGEVMEGLAAHSYYADLLVVGQTPPETLEDVLTGNRPDHSVLVAACPTLIVPHAYAETSVGRRALIAWKPTRQAARAVRDSLALLRGAAVVVLTIGADKASHAAGNDLVAYLGRHGVAAQTRSDYGDDSSVAGVILGHAGECGADLIVMGAYGHSRLREMILGGATNDMLLRTTVPLLLSH